MWKHWIHWIRSYFNYGCGQRDHFRLGCLPLKTSPNSGCFFPWPLSPRLSSRVEERLLLSQAPQMCESDGSLPEGRTTGWPEKWRRKILWSCHGAQGIRWLIMPQSHELTVSSLCGNSRATSLPQKHQPCIWWTWRKKALEETRMEGEMIPTESMWLLKNLWCAWQGLLRMPKQRRCAAITVVAQNILSVTVCSWITGKWQGGDSIEEGNPDPSNDSYHTKEPPGRGSQGIKPPQQTPFLNPDPF